MSRPETDPSARPPVPSSAQESRRPALDTLRLHVTPGQAALRPPHERTRFYLLTELVSPRGPAALDPAPLDLALAIDRSSSMRGAKLHYARQAVRGLLAQLRPQDLVTVVFFDDRPEVIVDGESVARRATIEAALDLQRARGGTEIAPALDAALGRLAQRQSRQRLAAVVLLTDGQTYGDEERCSELASRARELGIGLTALGLGTDWNRDLLDRLAAVSGGTSNFVEDPAQLPDIFDEELRRLRATFATRLRLTFEPAPAVAAMRVTRVAPEIAEAFAVAPGEAPPRAVAVDLGILADRPDAGGAAVLWELELAPTISLTVRNTYDLGRLAATYSAPNVPASAAERLEGVVSIPVNTGIEDAPIEADVRLALELITAYRLQAQADTLRLKGDHRAAAERMTTAALRLRAAGSDALAAQADAAARALHADTEQSVTQTLRVKYETKNRGIFHSLRRVRGGR